MSEDWIWKSGVDTEAKLSVDKAEKILLSFKMSADSQLW